MTGTMTDETSGIENRAVLVTLDIRKWAARKSVRNQRQAVADATSGDEDAWSVTAQLVDRAYLKPIRDVYDAAHAALKARSVPWGPGMSMLPAAKIQWFDKAMPAFREDFDEAVEALVEQYSVLVNRARDSLGTEFNEADYPSEAALRAKHSFTFGIRPVPLFDDIRVGLDPEVAQRLRNQGAEAERELAAQATADLADRMRKVLDRCVNCFEVPGEGEKARRIEDGLLCDIEEIAENFGGLNLVADKRLDAALEKFREGVAAHHGSDLRGDMSVRQSAQKAAKAIREDVMDMTV